MPAHLYSIPYPKILDYLLSIDHKRGRSKATVFLNRWFARSDPNGFALALFRHASDNWPGRVMPQAYGDSHTIVGPLRCPDGSTPLVLAVWKVERGSDTASLVTAYPYR